MTSSNLLSHLKLPVIPVLLLFCLCFPSKLYSQQQSIANPLDYLGISAGGGYTFTHTDFENTVTIPSPVAGVGIHYYSLQFLEISLDFQKGILKGGAQSFSENNKPGFKNDYMAFCLSFRFFPLALAENNDHDKILKALSCLYVGTGLGYLRNDVKANNMLLPEYGALVTYKGSDLFVPVELGVNIPIVKHKKNMFLLNFNLRTSLCLTDEVDGYDPTVEANKYNDAFSTFTAGIIYKFSL